MIKPVSDIKPIKDKEQTLVDIKKAKVKQDSNFDNLFSHVKSVGYNNI